MKNQIIGITVAAALVAILIGGAYFYGKRVADNQAKLHELQSELQTLKSSYSQLQIERSQIEISTKKSVEAMERTRTSLNDPERARQAIQSAVPNSDISIAPQRDSAGTVLPDAPSVAIIQNAPYTLPLLAGKLLDGNICQVSLQGCQKELATADASIANLNAQAANVGEQQAVKSKLACKLGCKAVIGVISIEALRFLFTRK